MIKKIFFLFFALLFFAALPAFADFKGEHWQFYKEMKPEEEGFYLIKLDNEVLSHCEKGFKDLRVVSSQGEEVPYQLIELEPSVIENYPSQVIDKIVRENEFSAVTLDLIGEGKLHNQVILNITNTGDYLRDVYIEGSNDNKTWDTITKAKLFKVANNRQNTLGYGAVSYRYIRVKIDCKGQEPLNIEGAKVNFMPRENSAAKNLPAEITAIEEDPETNSSIIFADLGTSGLYVDSISLQVNNKNFDRIIECYHSYDNKEWHASGSGRIFNYSWTDYSASQYSLPIKESCGRYIKIQIRNQDSPPLKVKGLEVTGSYPELLANLEGEKYYLWYGNPQSQFPQYDLTRFAHFINKAAFIELAAGRENVNSKYTQEKGGILESRVLLNLFTAAAALVVGLIILRNLISKKH